METDKFQTNKLEPKVSPDVLLQSKSELLGMRRADGVSCYLKVKRLDTQEEWMF
jgi:hypothetical protein